MALNIDKISPLEQTLKGLEGIAAYRSKNPVNPWDNLYYELLYRYFENLLKARERGQLVVT